MMTIEVIDTGIGITEENQKKLFKPFTQADSTTTKEFGGTGLGLAICSKLVTLLNGNISMTSVFGEGTCIKVIIPFKKLSNLIIQHNRKKKGIYIVEDNRSNQIVLSKYLQKLKIEYDSIYIYDNGHEILIDIDNIDPILIFMDLHMPKMNGIDTTIELRKNGVTCPIIAVTANSMNDIGERCIIAGMNQMILKPYSLNDISKILVDYTIL
jgi:CheY-like chemotaxis protein